MPRPRRSDDADAKKPKKARRGRGEGSIYQREDGWWVGSVSLGIGANGKRRRKTVYGRTKKEVQDKLREFDPTRAAADGPLTVAGFLNRWLDRVKPQVEPTTWDGYDQHVRLHISPRIGELKITALTAIHVEDLLAGLLKSKVSPAMTRKVGVTLRTTLNYAVRKKIIPVNVALAAELPKAPRYVPRVFTPDEITKFLKAAADDRFEAMYLVAIDGGLRAGELFALRWTDFDEKSGVVQIIKSLANRAGKLTLKETKTDRSRRSVTLSLSLDALARHRDRMKAEGWDPVTGLIFCNTTGGYVGKGNLRIRHFQPTLKRAKLPAIRFHDLRHCCASLLLAAGEDTKIVSERLGHASPAFTACVYQHILPGLQARAAERLKTLLMPKEEPAKKPPVKRGRKKG